VKRGGSAHAEIVPKARSKLVLPSALALSETKNDRHFTVNPMGCTGETQSFPKGISDEDLSQSNIKKKEGI